MLRDLVYQGVYKSDLDNILEDFYFPTLSVANRFDRAVGFFSASTISYAAQALSVFVKNGGRIRLVLGAFSDAGDVAAVKEGHRLREVSDKIGREFLEIVSGTSDDLFQNRYDTLAWLVAHGRLELKVALRAKGMYHDKVGIICDSSHDKVVFSGSANESTYALLPTYNYESINVFPSWREELSDYSIPHIESFERLWSNKSNGTAVLDFPEAIKENLISVARQLDYTPDPEMERAIAARLTTRTRPAQGNGSTQPKEPEVLNGRPFKLLPHQIAALEAWKSKGDFQGVLNLATGAGKTITAIHAIVKLSASIEGLCCVIAAPYQNLADQWVANLAAFNIYPIRCYVSRDNWEEKLKEAVHGLSMASRKFCAIVVVNRTLKSAAFQECLRKLNGKKLLWIGDECHHHTSKSFEGYLPDTARFRIGLSATPEHYLDDERNVRLSEFYGQIVYSYSLKQAILDKVLTPYVYYPHLVELNSIEADEFVALSEQIGQLFARQSSSTSAMSSNNLRALLMRRARLLGSAANKLSVLSSVLISNPTKHTLFYCGDGVVETEDTDELEDGVDGDREEPGRRQIELVSELLHGKGWDVSRFTARESRKTREEILENFRVGIIDAMVAIRCLDEGIDVPACGTAYILASSRDPRQFIQRRGRILRRSSGKELAIIHDFVVILPSGYENKSDYAKRLIRSELTRVAEFSSLSENRTEAYEILRSVLRDYDLEHLV